MVRDNSLHGDCSALHLTGHNFTLLYMSIIIYWTGLNKTKLYEATRFDSTRFNSTILGDVTLLYWTPRDLATIRLESLQALATRRYNYRRNYTWRLDETGPELTWRHDKIRQHMATKPSLS